MITLEIIDINDTVYNLCNKYPKIKYILYELGLEKIKNPIMFNTVSKMLTMKKAIKIKNIDFNILKKKLNEYGLDFILDDNKKYTDERNEILKSLIVKLHNGENPDTIKREFENKLFKVSAIEVHNAMAELIDKGMSIDEAKRFFYIRTLLLKDAMNNKNIEENYEAIEIFKEENREIEKLLNTIINKNNILLFNEFYNKINEHYSKKESYYFIELSKYGNEEPSKVMTKIDKEIIENLNPIINDNIKDEDKLNLIKKEENNILDMIFKEENILIPIAINTLNEKDFGIIKNKYLKNS